MHSVVISVVRTDVIALNLGIQKTLLTEPFSGTTSRSSTSVARIVWTVNRDNGGCMHVPFVWKKLSHTHN